MTVIALCQVGPAVLDPAQVEALVRRPGVGATVSFTGVVRDHDQGRTVTGLAYEAHPGAEAALRGILARCQGAEVVAAAHRTGQVALGEVAFVACAGAAHRREAFAACAEVVEAVKAELPVWKQQSFADGATEWVNAL